MRSKFVLVLAIILTVESVAGEIGTGDLLLYPQVVTAFYKSRNFQNVWNDRELVRQLEQAIGDAAEHGLRAEDYHFKELSSGKDQLLTDAFIAYAHDLRYGRALHRLRGVDWNIQHDDLELIPLLQEALSSGEVHKGLNELAPSFEAYRLLQSALAEYRKLAVSGGWPAFPEPIELEGIENSEVLDSLRNRLAMTQDLEPEMKLIEGVIRFQRRHGLRADGIVGKQTIAALSVTPEERVSQIELNLERLRWMPRQFPERSVVVNVPSFDLRVYQQGKMVQTMRVIVGQVTWCTPTFLSSEINQIILNPYWYVPTTIATREIFPLLKKDPGYLKRNNILMIPRTEGGVQLRQSPGPLNSLGKIKFLFPNCCNCYLHDTPAKDLFEKVLRLFSHGCIRMEQAMDLANWILEEEGWSAESLAAAIESNKTRTIRLARPAPVFIVYFTAWVDEQGFVQFRNDVYGKDKELKQSLMR